jgi:hypothetical protein
LPKKYCGSRTIDGLNVTVNNKLLSDHTDIKQFTEYGFEWTYEGESPQQLARAILFDFLGDGDKAISLSEPFMKSVVANLDNDWVLSESQISAAIKKIEKG